MKRQIVVWLITGMCLFNMAGYAQNSEPAHEVRGGVASMPVPPHDHPQGEDSAWVVQEEENPFYHENQVDVMAETAGLFSIKSTYDYKVMPLMATIGWQLDDVGNEGWRRGNTEWMTTGFFSPIFDAPENRMAGFAVGPRYNFVQPGWKFVPYIGSRVGVLFIDSTNARGAQGQDFCFTFFVEAGVRYDWSDRLSFTFGGLYQHVSNGGLSEPRQKNCGLDMVGPQVSAIVRF